VFGGIADIEHGQLTDLWVAHLWGEAFSPAAILVLRNALYEAARFKLLDFGPRRYPSRLSRIRRSLSRNRLETFT